DAVGLAADAGPVADHRRHLMPAAERLRHDPATDPACRANHRQSHGRDATPGTGTRYPRLKGRGDHGEWGWRARPVSAMNASMSAGRYWMLFSRVRTIAVSWSMPQAARLPRPRLTCDHTPSVGFSSGA